MGVWTSREVAWALFNSADDIARDAASRLLSTHEDKEKGIIYEAKIKSFKKAGSNRNIVTTQELNKYLRWVYKGAAVTVDEEKLMREWEDETPKEREEERESRDESQQTKEGKPDRYEYEGGW